MRVPLDAADPTDGVFALLSAVGDGFAGHRLGFGLRRAAVAARFARHRGGDEGALAANWIAGALAEIGNLDVLIPPDAGERIRLLAYADAPVHGARFVAALPGMPPGAADMIRWHREHEDGTGYPDRLRWDGIPADAAALGIVNAFLEAVEDPAEPREPNEALFTLFTGSGRRFRVELVRAFHAFVMSEPGFDEPLGPALPALDEDAVLDLLATRIDVRDGQTVGRSERLVATVVPLAEQLGLDGARAARLARLFALGRVAADLADHHFDPRAEARRAGEIAAAVPRYAPEAPLLAVAAERYEDAAHDRLAAVLALGVAVDTVVSAERAQRVTAGAGTQFDPDVARAYLASLGTTA
ncbi:MAG TPA: HD domain-containing phosphohydrolase [Candidatus Limnocylindria bacterium]|nr:HD domain-containing phosphohydrolase [Candidatus Limnocylindria bacterium]